MPLFRSESVCCVADRQAHPISLKSNFCGTVRLSSDEMQVYAMIDGEPSVNKTGKISVFSELKIDGDVDFRTGNIEFQGNVYVNGIIKDGFRVRCGSLLVSEILAADIDVEGDIVVKGGIIGAQIRTQGALSAKFIKDSNIKAFGDVVVEKEVFNSKIRSSGRLISEKAKLISSYLSAYQGIQLKDVGTDVSKPCRLKIGVDENVRKILQGVDIQIALKKKELETAQADYEAQRLLPPKVEAQISSLTDFIQRIDEKLSSIQGRLAGFTEVVEAGAGAGRNSGERGTLCRYHGIRALHLHRPPRNSV